MKPIDGLHSRSSQDSEIWIYGSGDALTKRPKKVGIVSTEEHCHPHAQALKKMGFKVVKLGGNPSSIPRSLHFVILRHESCSHTASDTALGWVRRSPKTRILAIANSLTRIRQAAQGYLDDFPLDQSAIDAADAVRETERRRKTPMPPIVVKKRKTRKRPPDFKPLEKPMTARNIVPEQDTYLSSALHQELCKMNVATQAIYKMIEATQSIGCGIEDLRAQWNRDYGHPKTKSTMATILVRLKKGGFIKNIGGEGRLAVGKNKAGWYVSTVFHTRMEGDVLKAFEKYCGRLSLSKKRAAVKKEPAPSSEETQEKASDRTVHHPQETQEKARSGFSPKKPVQAFPKPVIVDEDPYKAIRDETELLVMWMREWNVDSIAINRAGEVRLSEAPSHNPKLAVRFVTPDEK
jgi:hypothetical protein